MRIEREAPIPPPFQKITITIESKAELESLVSALECVYENRVYNNTPIRSLLFRLKEELKLTDSGR